MGTAVIKKACVEGINITVNTLFLLILIKLSHPDRF